MSKDLILSSFEATGIWPHNPAAVLSRWDDDSDDGYRTPPAIEADDWRSIDRLFERVVGDNTSGEARQLRRTLHHLSARAEMLTAENKRLSAVIATQNPLKKKRGALDMRQKKKGRSDAQLYSPSKVRDARRRHALDETKRLEGEVAKHHRREERAATTLRNKLEKERRSVAYAAKLEASRQKKAEEAAERERRKHECNAANSIQLSQLGKRKASQKPQKKPQKRQRRTVGVQRSVGVSKG
jgi:hypothetical protein